MRISIIIKANAKQDKVELPKVSVKAPAKEGKANEAVIKLLAEYFEVPKSSVIIKSGLKSKHKIIEIEL
ncbi:MAG TPA: DUF167 domain-containing protein [Candidatus Paceibacterota bacterium]|nr:DUF167 domain-containing protein [Candidatus Paceibacterota bacterium]